MGENSISRKTESTYLRRQKKKAAAANLTLIDFTYKRVSLFPTMLDCQK